MKYLFLSLISAILLSISWPTYGVAYFIFVALVPLLMMEHHITHFSKIKRKSLFIFWLSYLCFMIWNIITTGWLYGAKNPDGSHSMMAVLFPVLVNSLLYSIVFILYHHYKKIQGTYWGLAFFIAIWLSFEKFHLDWEFSWPWLNLGNVFADNPKIIQWYDTLGVSGGSLWILLVNILIFYTIRTWEAGRKKANLIKNCSIVALLLIIPIIISYYKYKYFNEKSIGETSVLMLQPDLDPYTEKYQMDSLSIAKELLSLTKLPDSVKIDYYLAPETAFGNSFSEKGFQNSLIINNIRNLLTQKQAVFVGGISSHQFFYDKNIAPANAYQIQGTEVWVENFNSAVQITPNKEIQTYHKGKLVPGVEIFPYIQILKPILGDAMLNFGGTISSLGTDKTRKVFKNPYNKSVIAPIICYESIYGEFVTEYVRNGANFLGIMTNDSWWGRTQGHQQLLAYARLRAIENRREVVRSANSGISAHINALGEIEQATLYGDQTKLYAKVKLYEGKSTYTRIGDLVYRIAIFTLGFLLFYTAFEMFKSRKKSI